MRKATYLRLKKTVTTLVLLAAIFGSLYVYFQTGFFSITNYKIVGAPEEYVESLDRGARLVAEDRMLYIFPGNRVISYHDDELRTLIMETLPNTRKISMYPSGLHTLVIKLESHVPVFSVSDTHAIAEDGTVYKEIVSLADFPRLEVASSSSVHPRTLRSVADLIEKLDAVLFEIKYVVVDDYNDIRLYDERRKGAVVISSEADMDAVWSNVLSAIDTDPLKGKLASKEETLEYIDTRFGNKVFYKFTNGQSPAIIPEHADVATTTIQ